MTDTLDNYQIIKSVRANQRRCKENSDAVKRRLTRRDIFMQFIKLGKWGTVLIL